MVLIIINFVLEFAKDLQMILENIEQEFRNNFEAQNSFHKRQILKKTSELTLELYKKYNNIFSLKIKSNNSISNIVVITIDKDVLNLPGDFFETNKYRDIKTRFDDLLYLMKLGNWNWDYFLLNLHRIFYFSHNKLRPLNVNTLEKIRLFMKFVNRFPDFDFQNYPNNSNVIYYTTKYAKWGKKKSYSFYYEKYIEKDHYLFPHHIAINPIPNYKLWNLNLIFLENNFSNIGFFEDFNYFPIQIFENLDKSLNSIIGLVPNLNNTKIKSEFLVEKIHFVNNFDLFQVPKIRKPSLLLNQPSFFDSYIKYFSELNEIEEKNNLTHLTYEYDMNFKKDNNINEEICNYQNRRTIAKFNLQYLIELSNFQELYTSNEVNTVNPYRILFQNRYSFPDFDTSDNFLMIIKKKRNSKFKNFLNFLKNWCYQSIIYELKDEIIIYGYLLANFNYSKESIHIGEIFKKLNLEFKFFHNNTNIRRSNLTLYSLPQSSYYSENNLEWNFIEIGNPITIKEKNDIIIRNIDQERKNQFYL